MAAKMEEVMNSKFQGLSESMSKLDAKLDGKFAEMLKAIRLLAEGRAGASGSGDRNYPPLAQVHQQPPGHFQSPFLIQDSALLRPPTVHHMPYAPLTRLSRLDFPRFNGDKVKDWMFKCDQFFLIDRTPADIRVNLASIHLDDDAASWHKSVMLSDESKCLIGDWKAYKVLLVERFGEIVDDPIAELKNLQETDGIMAYHCQFEMIRNRVQLPEPYLVSVYLAGLRNDTQMHVRMFQPHTIRQCFTVAKLYEATHPHIGNTAVTSTFSGSTTMLSAQKRDGNSVTKPLASAPGELTANVPEAQKTKKMLTVEEMNDRRDKGLCYFSDEKYSADPYLNHKKGQIFMLATEDEEPMVDTSEVFDDEDIVFEEAQVFAKLKDFEPSFPNVPFNTDLIAIQNIEFSKSVFQATHISCPQGVCQNASAVPDEVWCLETPPWPPDVTKLLIMHLQLPKMSGVDGFSTMQVKGIRAYTVSPMKSTRVALTNGNTLQVSAKVENFELSFQNVSFITDLLVIPLGKYDMVLGVQWLATLGTIDVNRRVLRRRRVGEKERVKLV